jgi:hypothetical protein
MEDDVFVEDVAAADQEEIEAQGEEGINEHF